MKRYLLALALCALACTCTAADVNPDNLAASVRVNCSNHSGNVTASSHGSAVAADLSSFGLKGDKYLLTAAHVVKDVTKTITIEIGRDAAKHWAKCSIVRVSSGLDIAVIECEESPGHLAQLSADKPAAGDALTLIGFPCDVGPCVFAAHYAEDEGFRAFMAVPFYHGDSGAPVFNGDGKLVGIAVAGVAASDDSKSLDMCQIIGIYIKSADIAKFLSGKDK